MQIGKFREISTELWPLTDVRNLFSLSVFGIFSPIFLKLSIRVDMGKDCTPNKYRVVALDLCPKLHFCSISFEQMDGI